MSQNNLMQAYGLLLATTLFWGGNAVAGKIAVGDISPMLLTCLRWGITAVILIILQYNQIYKHRHAIKENLLFLFIMGSAGFSLFNSFLYGSAYFTTAVNITILQGAMPILVLLGGYFIFREKLTFSQIIGAAITLFGVLIVAGQGSLSVLLNLNINFGDALMLIACLFYSGYTLALRQKPKLPTAVFFSCLAISAFVTSCFLLVGEIALGQINVPNYTGWGTVIYVSIFPSLLAQFFFILAVEKIGPSRSGLFINLVPVFGALLAVLILQEAFLLYHGIALLMVLGGIFLAETSKIKQIKNSRVQSKGME